MKKSAIALGVAISVLACSALAMTKNDLSISESIDEAISGMNTALLKVILRSAGVDPFGGN